MFQSKGQELDLEPECSGSWLICHLLAGWPWTSGDYRTSSMRKVLVLGKGKSSELVGVSITCNFQFDQWGFLTLNVVSCLSPCQQEPASSSSGSCEVVRCLQSVAVFSRLPLVNHSCGALFIDWKQNILCHTFLFKSVHTAQLVWPSD